jgi:DNA-binding IclR family transcriptional regulator
VAAINVSGPSFRVRSRLDEIGAGVADAATRLSAALRGS